jgi:hypothetical protein
MSGQRKLASGKINDSHKKPTGTLMSNPHSHSSTDHGKPAEEADAIEAIVPMMPLVLPLAGGVLIFMLAFIAVVMA